MLNESDYCYFIALVVLFLFSEFLPFTRHEANGLTDLLTLRIRNALMRRIDNTSADSADNENQENS